jgi:hypothetical protein
LNKAKGLRLVGMMEFWNIGMMGFEKMEYGFMLKPFITRLLKWKRSIKPDIPSFQHSIIPLKNL